MDSEYTYQPQYIWKQTTHDGVLPITNFTEEIKEDSLKKRGKEKEKGKELGQMTDFSNEEEMEKIKQKGYANGSYVYLASRQKYGLIRSKKSDTVFVMRVKSKGMNGDHEEVEVDIEKEEVLTEIELSIRVVVD